MVIESPTTKYFSAAVQQICEASGHGAQANLARRARVSPSYLSDLLAGRKAYWPDPVKERVAAVCGYSVAELLEIGENYVRDGVFFPYGKKLAETAARSIERLVRIYQIAAHDAGLKNGQVLFTVATVPAMFGTVASDFCAGVSTDAKTYNIARAFCASCLGL